MGSTVREGSAWDRASRRCAKLRLVELHRIVPNLKVDDASAGHAFYVECLGLKQEFDLGWIASFRDPENRSIPVSLVSGDASTREDSVLSAGVADVDATYARARELGYQIVYPLTHEPWGVPPSFETRTGTSSTSWAISTDWPDRRPSVVKANRPWASRLGAAADPSPAAGGESPPGKDRVVGAEPCYARTDVERDQIGCSVPLPAKWAATRKRLL